MKNSNTIQIINSPHDDSAEEVKISMDILDRIHELLNKKFNGKQILLAKKLGKSEAEVSKWLSGVQNFTIRTIAKLHLAFEEPIIAVCSDDGPSFEQVGTFYKKSEQRLIVKNDGNLQTEFTDVKVTDNNNITENQLF